LTSKNTFSSNHNGQKIKKHLFTDGEDEFEFLSYARIIEEYEEVNNKFGKIVPFLKIMKMETRFS